MRGEPKFEIPNSRFEQALQGDAFSFIPKLLEKFPKAEMYLVGGAVRDMLTGRATKDYDFVVRNVPAKELEEFLGTLGHADLVGRVFGVFKFSPQLTTHNSQLTTLEPFDLALPRTEHSLSMAGGYKDFEIQSDPTLPIEEDLARRDFTVNAIALRMRNMELGMRENDLIDPTGGIEDLGKKKLRAVGDPKTRFREDYSRMLRGIRLACELGFSFEEKTWKAIQDLMPRINDSVPQSSDPDEADAATSASFDISNSKFQIPNSKFVVPRETIGRELVKAFVADPVKAVDLLDTSGGITALMPETLKMKGCPQPQNWHTEGDVWVHDRLALVKLKSEEFKTLWEDEQIGASPIPYEAISRDAEVVIGTWLHDLGKPYTITTPERDGTDRIRFHGHDMVGAEMTVAIVERLAMTQFPTDSPLHINTEHLSFMIQKHLMPVAEKIERMKPSTVEKYFFSARYPGEKLLAVSLADQLSTIHQGGKPDTSNYIAMRARMKELAALGKDKGILPDPLLSGHDVMKLLNLEPSPKVGELLALVREKQLSGDLKTKEDALKFLKPPNLNASS